jgi:PAS domain S-box-containing protein
MVRNISARKRAEEQLRSSEEQYRSIFNAAQDSMVLRDADLRVVDANAAYTALSGYSREEVLGRDTVPTSPPEQMETIKALHRRALAGEPVHFELPARHKDGRGFELELRGVPAQHQGRPHVLYVGRDISERKRAEEALRLSEEQYRSVFNATAEALVLRDTEARVVDVNRAFLEMSGYSRDEVVGQTRWFFAGPEMSAAAKEMHARVCAGESVHFEVYGYRKDGSRLDVEMHAVPMLYRGKPHALGMARDITARKRADAERAQLEAQLRQAQKMEAIGHLAGGIAHDFNNILTSIQGYAQLAAERPSAAADAKLSSYLDHLELACNRARELIQQMLVFSRGRRGAARALALAPVVRQAIRLLRSSLPATLEIVPEFAPDLPAALLDPVQAEQVLMNLCINAHDAMQGRGTVQVAVTRQALSGMVCASCRGVVSGAFVELSVADEGPGISVEVTDRMFEPFFTTKETGRGTGMGLAIVHGIVHEHGGHILVESNSTGARFRVLFPAVAASQATEVSARRRAAAPASPLKGRVLLVDDEQMVARFMRELLQGWGLKVTAVTSATEAKQVFRRAPQDFDVLLTDYTMPRMTGLDLAQALRAVRPRLPVIVYSGYTDVIPEAELGAPPVEVVQKPIDQEALLAALTKHL